MNTEFRLKRIYDDYSTDDGFRLLVDRLWPRGVSKQEARIDAWAKPLTPSDDLRKWFHEDPDRQAEFATQYVRELDEHKAEVDEVLASIDQETVTLVTATKDLQHGHAAILKDYLERR